MKDLENLINNAISSMNLVVDEIKYESGNPNTLYITLDSNDVIDINKIVEASNVISPIVDKYNFTSESFVLDISSKEKGVKEDE